MTTYTVTVRGRFGAHTLNATSSETAARRVALSYADECEVRLGALDVAMHHRGAVVPVARYQWNGDDVQLVGRP